MSNTRKDFGADRALVASDQARAGLGPSGFDHGYGGLPMWAAGSLAAAKFELKRLQDALGDEPQGASRVSIYAADLSVLIAAIEQMGATQSTGETK